MICGKCHEPVDNTGVGYLIQRTNGKRIETIAIIPCHDSCDPNMQAIGKLSLELLSQQLGGERALKDFCLDLRKDNLLDIFLDALTCWRGVSKFKRHIHKQEREKND